jgi:hypothetical protein
VLTVSRQLREPWRTHAPAHSGDWKSHLYAVLESVKLPAYERFLRLYSRQLSVGVAAKPRGYYRHGVLSEPSSTLGLVRTRKSQSWFAA